MGFYSREGMRAARDQRNAPPEPPPQRSIFEEVPPDVEYDDALLTVWNGERFVFREKWLAAAPIESLEPPDGNRPAVPADAACVSAGCGGTRIWLAKDGDRWLMFAGSRRSVGRRKDFASPSLAHSMSTAEQWYGPPEDGWRVEEKRKEKERAADLLGEGAPAADADGNGGIDDRD